MQSILLLVFLLRQNTVVAIENPGYPDVRNIFSFKTDNIIPISVDKDGIVVKEIKSDTNIVFTTPSHQYPTGVTMSMERRKQPFINCKRKQYGHH